jgi:hypothetical protein
MNREIQRTLMELLNQLDGFEVLSKVKIIMATNRYSAMIASDVDLCNMIKRIVSGLMFWTRRFFVLDGWTERH